MVEGNRNERNTPSVSTRNFKIFVCFPPVIGYFAISRNIELEKEKDLYFKLEFRI